MFVASVPCQERNFAKVPTPISKYLKNLIVLKYLNANTVIPIWSNENTIFKMNIKHLIIQMPISNANNNKKIVHAYGLQMFLFSNKAYVTLCYSHPLSPVHSCPFKISLNTVHSS